MADKIVHELKAETYFVGWEPIRTFPKDGRAFHVMGDDGVATLGYWDVVHGEIRLAAGAPHPLPRTLTHWAK
jgi:hypothetical protein